MFAIAISPTWFAKTDDFKKIGKKIQKQRKTEVDKIKDKISDIARDEQRREGVFQGTSGCCQEGQGD
jgi:hypothetical protein